MLVRWLAGHFDMTYPEIACDGDHSDLASPPCFRGETESGNNECEAGAAAAGWLSMPVDGERVHFCPECAVTVPTTAAARALLRMEGRKDGAR